MDLKLENKVAVITGGSAGIGREISMSFAKVKTNVAILSSNISKYSQSLAEELDSYGVQYKLYKCDVSDYDQVSQTTNDIIEKFGHIDILVNNAGITKDGLLLKMTPEDFDRVVDINLKGTFNFTRCIAPHMYKQKSGRIINITSIVGIYGNFGQSNYSASKAGIIGFTKATSKELGRRNITVNAIAPGYIETLMTGVIDEKQKAKMTDRLVIKRLGQPKDVADLAIFLASEKASYITGQVIQVDGGISI